MAIHIVCVKMKVKTKNIIIEKIDTEAYLNPVPHIAQAPCRKIKNCNIFFTSIIIFQQELLHLW
jgi:hypothetical protein